ncbi:MAG: PDZ domain-containing protein [Candidatus Omnitrophica bacterium]|nr:PDZ domain-containing protein [Candidatus Omnitrophota bacterium]
MALNNKSRTMAVKMRNSRATGFPLLETSIAVVVLVILTALFFNTKNMPPQGASRVAQTAGGSALEFDVVTVNPIIAKDFNLPYAAGVLVNSTPTGASRRLIDIQRGDVILKYNNVDVQSANHFAYLMSTSKPGDNVIFIVSRNGQTLTVAAKIPVETGFGALDANGVNVFVSLVIIIVTFAALFLNLFNRTVCVTLGAVLMLIAGTALGFYNQSEAFDAIHMSPIFVLVGMSVFSIFLEDLKFFEYFSKRMVLTMKGDKVKIILTLCILTAVASAFMNNISIILIVIPITIYVAKGLSFDPIPVVISEVISSAVGGNMTPIGDFSNMLIATSAGLTFVDFLLVMVPICAICLGIFLWYMWYFEFRHIRQAKSSTTEKAFLKKIADDVEEMDLDWPAIKRVLYVLGSVIAAFIILPFFKVRLAPIALGGGFILLAIENQKAKNVIKKISLTDILFFIALFLIVGGALYSGLLKIISDVLTSMAMGNQVLYLILLMWTMAVFTSFMNAGPATAFFIPIIMSSGYADFTDLVWWALNLGSIAGSCACISGASAGIISQTLVEDLYPARSEGQVREGLTFSSYSRRGIPAAIMFLIMSSIYIVILSMLP